LKNLYPNSHVYSTDIRQIFEEVVPFLNMSLNAQKRHQCP